MSDNNNTSGGVSAFSLLGFIFVTLKLTGFIDWSWWYVTMPFWLPLSVVFSMVLLVAFIAVMRR